MALKISAGEGVKRGDIFFVNPFEITMSEELRGRSKPPTEQEIIDRALSMMEHGQLQPVEVRRIDAAGHVVVTYGYTRTAAARLIRTGFVNPLTGETVQNENFMLQIKVVDCNEKEAFIRNIVENKQRNETTPIDDAINQRRLRDDYGYNDTEIATLYEEKNTNRVAKLRKLLVLEDRIQDLVHQGLLAVDPAVLIIDLPEDQRWAACEAATNGKGKVDGSAIKSQVREHHLSDDHKVADGATGDGEETPASGGKKSVNRSMREVKKFFDAVAANEEGIYVEAEVRFAKDTMKFMAGKTTDKAMGNALRRLLEAKPLLKK